MLSEMCGAMDGGAQAHTDVFTAFSESMILHHSDAMHPIQVEMGQPSVAKGQPQLEPYTPRKLIVYTSVYRLTTGYHTTTRASWPTRNEV